MIRPKMKATQERVQQLFLSENAKPTPSDKRWAASLLVQWGVYETWFPHVRPEKLAAKLLHPELTLLAMDMYNMSEATKLNKFFAASNAVKEFEDMLRTSDAKLADLGLTENDVASMKRRCYILEVKLGFRIALRGDELTVAMFEETENLMRKWDITAADLGRDYNLKTIWRLVCSARVKTMVQVLSSQRFLKDEAYLLELWLCSRETGRTLEQLGISEEMFKEFRKKVLR